jgi:hypothetical protein
MGVGSPRGVRVGSHGAGCWAGGGEDALELRRVHQNEEERLGLAPLVLGVGGGQLATPRTPVQQQPAQRDVGGACAVE